jgi:serpin B
MKLAFLSLPLALLLACAAPKETPTTPSDNVVPPAATAPLQPAPLPPDAPSLKSLAEANNTFGLALWKQLSTAHQGNLAVSPASISLALSMTLAGASGPTAEQMQKTLALTASPHTTMSALLNLWSAPDRPYALRIANRLFGEKTTTFLAPFLDTVATQYGAPLEPVDFATAPDTARLHINNWVATRTEDKVKDLLPSGSIDADARLVLVNAIYFKGDWLTRFDAAQTSTADFATPGGPKPAKFMRLRTDTLSYAQTDNAALVELPYSGKDLAMTIVLPNADTSLAAFEAALTPASLDAAFAALHPTSTLTVALPRFRIATDTLPLRPTLEALGMTLPFGPDADFTAMTPADLFIKNAFHKVFVEVNEEGTEAAAATAVVMNRKSAAQPVSFTADRPFLFFIRDLRTNHILFMGRVTDPS